MARRVLILRAGMGVANNLVRSLRAGDPSLVVVGCHSDRFVLKKSPADRNYLLPDARHADFVPALRRLVERERIDLVMPNSEPEVKLVSDLRAELPCFLPPPHVIDLCQDKHDLSAFLRARGLATPLTYPVTDLASIGRVFRKLPRQSRLWCRMRTGTGSMGATPVKTPAQARSWIAYWREMRGVPVTAFTLSEYLPGRDYSLQCLWKDGTLVLAKMCERLSYFGGGNNPSGMSSTPALAKTVFEPAVVDLCTRAMRALDDRASGVFCFDLKESDGGVPCITEINAGRFAMITNIYDLVGKHNMATTFVRLALGDPVELREEYDVTPDYYLVRDLDTHPGIFHAEELFEGIEAATP